MRLTEPYAVIGRALVSERIDAEEYTKLFFCFSHGSWRAPAHIDQEMDELFYIVEDFIFYPELRQPGDLDDAQFRREIDRVMSVLTRKDNTETRVELDPPGPRRRTLLAADIGLVVDGPQSGSFTYEESEVLLAAFMDRFVYPETLATAFREFGNALRGRVPCEIEARRDAASHILRAARAKDPYLFAIGGASNCDDSTEMKPF
jgi:hypothetical protein